MRWGLRLVEYNFHVMYKKGPRNVHDDALFRLQTLAEVTAGDWDQTPSFLLCEQFSEQTEINHVINIAVPLKLRYRHNRGDIQLQQDDNATGNSTCLDDMAPDELIATLPVFKSADSMFEPISEKEMATAQLHDAFCVDIGLRPNDRVAIPFGDNEDRILCRQVTQDQIVIPHALK